MRVKSRPRLKEKERAKLRLRERAKLKEMSRRAREKVGIHILSFYFLFLIMF